MFISYAVLTKPCYVANSAKTIETRDKQNFLQEYPLALPTGKWAKKRKRHVRETGSCQEEKKDARREKDKAGYWSSRNPAIII